MEVHSDVTNRNHERLIAVCIVALVCIGIFFGLAFAQNVPKPSASATATTAMTSDIDPYTMPCSQLHTLLLQYQNQVKSDAGDGYGSVAQVVSDEGLLNYYAQIYNERIQLEYQGTYGAPAIYGATQPEACQYP